MIILVSDKAFVFQPEVTEVSSGGLSGDRY